MNGSFESRIKQLLAEITALKTVRLRASSVIPSTSEDVTINPTIIGMNIGGTNYAFAEKAGVVTIELNEPGFAQVSVITNSGARRYFTETTGDTNNNQKFRLYIQFPSAADVSELGGTGRKTIPVQLRITATCDFSYTITQEDV